MTSEVLRNILSEEFVASENRVTTIVESRIGDLIENRVRQLVETRVGEVVDQRVKEALAFYDAHRQEIDLSVAAEAALETEAARD